MSNRIWLYLGALALIWGASFLSTHIMLETLSPSVVVLHRVVWAALFLWGLALWRGWKLPLWQLGFDYIVMGFLGNLLPFALISWGQTHIESGLASILNASTAIFGAMLAPMFFADERLTLNKGIGIALGFCGVITAIGWEFLGGLSWHEWGQLAVIGATMSYAFSGIWAKTRLGGQPPETNAIGMLTASSMMIIIAQFLFIHPERILPDSIGWIALFYTAIMATAVAYLLYYRALALAGAGNVTLVTLLVPPVGITLGAIMLGEKFSTNEWIGFMIIAFGLLVIDGRIFRYIRPKRNR